MGLCLGAWEQLPENNYDDIYQYIRSVDQATSISGAAKRRRIKA